MKNTPILCAIAFCLTTLSAAYAASPIQISADPCFAEMTAGGTFPVKITVENYGHSVQGDIEVQQNGFGMSSHVYDYPIDLPAGTIKQLIAYPRLDPYASSITIDFDGPERADEDTMAVGNGGVTNAGITIGLISTDVGAFQSIRTSGESVYQAGATPYNDSYCLPADAPDRSAGYDGLKIVAIGEGAETLSDDQWSAIQEYVVSGGSLLLVGGAGSLAYLQTDGGSALSPLSNLQQIDLSTIKIRTSSGMRSFSNVPVVTGTVKPGAFVLEADGSTPLLISQHYGAGLVTLAAFNPLAQPIQGVDGAPQILKPLVEDSLTAATSTLLSHWANGQFGESDNEYSTYMGGSIIYGSGATGGTAYMTAPDTPEKNNPFQIKLPSFGEVAFIFAAYFLLAIPITYAVLKRIGKLELAWFTTPIISILFAFVFYFFSASLYSASLTKRTAGVLTVATGSSSANFRGLTEVFIPRGGSYNIAIPNAESLEMSSPNSDNPYGGSSNTQSIETTDTVNGVAADGMNVGNLAFRRFYYDQPVALSGAITSSISSNGSSMTGSITNGTQLTLSDAALTFLRTKKSVQLGTIAPGETVTLDKSSPCSLPAILRIGDLTSNINVKDKNSAYLVATTNAAPFGLQMGDDVSGPKTAALLTTIPVNGPGGSL